MSEHRRIAVVTGAGTGVGRLSSIALAAAGFTVVLAGRRPGPLAEAAAAAGNGSIAVPCDVGDAEQVRALFATVAERFGRLDLLFNNAGVFSPDVPLEDISVDQWSAIVAANVTGPFLCTQEAFRLMKRQDPRGGRIVNNGSLSAHRPRVNSAPYTTTKHAITGLTQSTALDGRPFGIACGQIDIGNAATDMTHTLATAGVTQASGAVVPEPTIDAAHVARALVYMATLPLDANVLTMTVMATGMPFVGRG